MKISIRSRILVYIGRIIYGDPKGFGLDCSAEEFYALSNERPIINQRRIYIKDLMMNPSLSIKQLDEKLYGRLPHDFHPQEAGTWKVMRRNLLIDQVRMKVFKHMAISATVAAAAIFFSGSLLVSGIVKGKETISEIRAKSKAEDVKENQNSTANKQEKIKIRAQEIVEELSELQSKANDGNIDQQAFEKKQKALTNEYKKLQEAL